ncbi:MAG: creatininase family protein [Infirmifilum uzonense]|uniref:creatininase family protein n=1 Tax=Infirmifilum TaxID=2856573 RepID=UPI003C73F161
MVSGESSWVDVKEYLGKASFPVAILPVGAVEAHGPHLPLVTDSLIAEAIAQEVGRRVNAFVLPVFHYGALWSLRSFPGSISISSGMLAGMIYEIGQAIMRHGFKLLVVINSHVGNVDGLKEGLRRLLDDGLNVMVFNPSLILEMGAKVAESPFWHKTYYHAEEIETSLLLYLAPHLVKMDKAVMEYPEKPFDLEYTFIPWDKLTRSGVIGDATRATPEKGKTIFEGIVEEISSMILKEVEKLQSSGEDGG